MSEKEWPTLGFSVKGNRYEIKATRGEIYEAYTDDQIIELVDRRAIAAKDARIAELEELVDRCIITLDAYDIEATALDDARLYVTGQQQAQPVDAEPFTSKEVDAIIEALEPSTRSEDGREPIPDCCQGENCGTRTADHSPECISETERDIQEWVKSSQSSGYSVQHERIVAALAERLEEAERLVSEAWRLMPDDGRVAVSVWHLCASEFINSKSESRAALAQPARHVGGAALSMVDYLRMANEAFGRVVDHDLIGNPITDYDVLLRGAYGPAVRRLVELAVSRAALAPAAVAVVMPEPLHVPNVHGYSRAFGEGYNECLEEVYRLNRRAIPAGLLERIAKIPLGSQGLLDHASAMDELRALLGKEGE